MAKGGNSIVLKAMATGAFSFEDTYLTYPGHTLYQGTL